MYKKTLIAVGIMALTACATNKEVSTNSAEKPAPAAKKPAFPNTEVAEGSTLYAENCGKCHALKNVDNYSPDQWKRIVPNMAAKAKIDATKEAKILEFVLWETTN
jgi:predicted secreted protein